METAPEVYLHWIMTYLHEAEVEIITNHVVKNINGVAVDIANIYKPSGNRRINANAIVMATARSSNNALYHLLRRRGVSVETIGCANAPRTVYEATFEGHRAARKLGTSQWRRVGQDTAQGHVPQYFYDSSLS
jgi:predicted flavoprotein YhiN